MLLRASLLASFDWLGSPSIWPTHALPGDPDSCAFCAGCPCPCHLLAPSGQLPLSRLIVAKAIPIASQAFTTVALQHSIGGAAVVATAIVVNMTTTAPISLVGNIAASIITKSNLASGTLAPPAVRGLTDLSAELLRSFAMETLVDRIRLLAFDCTVKHFLLEESLKKGCDGLDGLVVKLFLLKTNFSWSLLWYDI